MKYMFFIRIIRLVKLCAVWKQDPSSNWRCKIPMWFTGAYIKNGCWKILIWFNEAYIYISKYRYVRQINFQDIYFREFKEKRY